MNLESQVVSLELAKRLKELGVKQESAFVWALVEPSKRWPLFHARLVESWCADEKCSAFTVAELGEMLKGRGLGTSSFSKISGKWWVSGGEWVVEKQKSSYITESESWADALAAMLIHLIEKGLVKP